MATIKASEFVADMRKANLDIDPLGGEELQKIIVETMSTPPGLVEQARRYVSQ
jgi:hypothetical protein